MRWEPANGKPGYADLCIKLMDAAYSIVPNALFLVEGTAQSGLAYNWGERHQPLHAKQLLSGAGSDRASICRNTQLHETC